MRQIEALAQVDAFARDSLSRLELDMAWRRWKEGLTRTLALGYVRRWEMGDEMPTPTELRDFLKNHFTDSPHEKLNMAAALQDRFRESPPVAPSILMDKIHALWLFLPTHHPEGRWLFDENPGVAAISWWRWTALRLFGSRLAHLPVDARLLPWLAAASLPSSSGLPLLDSAASSLWFTAAAWPADLHLDMLGRAWAGFPGPIAAGLSALALQGHTPPAAAPPAPPARL